MSVVQYLTFVYLFFSPSLCATFLLYFIFVHGRNPTIHNHHHYYYFIFNQFLNKHLKEITVLLCLLCESHFWYTLVLPNSYVSRVFFLFPEEEETYLSLGLLVMYHASFTLPFKIVFDSSLHLVHDLILNREVKCFVILSICLIVSSSCWIVSQPSSANIRH